MHMCVFYLLGHLCAFFSTLFMFVMHILDIPVYVKELVFPPVYPVLMYHGYTNSNNGPW